MRKPAREDSVFYSGAEIYKVSFVASAKKVSDLGGRSEMRSYAKQSILNLVDSSNAKRATA